jgi:hypothetical protein
VERVPEEAVRLLEAVILDPELVEDLLFLECDAEGVDVSLDKMSDTKLSDKCLPAQKSHAQS